MRSRLADHIYKSESFDYGDSWSEPVATPLPNNNSGISAIKLKSGRIAIAYNPASAPEAVKNGSAWPGLRCPVAVALSEDGGNTFPMIRVMELGEGYIGDENKANNRQYEYPYLLQAKDGSLHLTFAYQTRRGVKWMTFSEEDVRAMGRTAAGVKGITLRDKDKIVGAAIINSEMNNDEMRILTITEEGYGNPDTDLMMNCRKVERKGVKVVLITDEFPGKDGKSQSLADTCEEATALASCGQGNATLKFPVMDRIIGTMEYIENQIGGWAGCVNEDGSFEAEIQIIIASTIANGFNKLAARGY